MQMQPLKIQLFPKEDKDGCTFYIGKLKLSATIRLTKGITFFVTIREDVQELHLCNSTEKEFYHILEYYKNCRRKPIRNRHSNICVDLVKAEVDNDDKIYIGNIKTDIDLRADDGLVFLVFVADTGEEELQISAQSEKKKDGH